MNKLLITGAALVLAGSLAVTLALAQTASTSSAPASAASNTTTAPKPSGGSRQAICQADCRPGKWNAAGVGMHGHYRAYGSADPNLKSPEAQKMYAECVRICLAPLPTNYFQKPIIEGGGSWFGKRKADCLKCHARGETKNRWPGSIMRPTFLRREPTQ